MEAAKFLKEFNRMCLSYDRNCKGCPFEKEDLSCILNDPENADSIVETVEKWSKEHPFKTRMEDFLEKYPNAATFKASKGKEIPRVCCMSLGYTDKCYTKKDFSDCTACWCEPLH